MKCISVLSLLCFIVSGAFGQNQEVNFGMGVLSHPALKTIHPFAGFSDGEDDYTISPVFLFSYSCLILPDLNIGVTIAYEHQSHDSYSIIPGHEEIHHIYKEAYFTGLLYAHYHWLQKGIWDIYSGMGLGWDFLKQDNQRNDFSRNPEAHKTRSGFAYQLAALGLRAGKRLGGYAELGYGYKGLVLCGISYRF